MKISFLKATAIIIILSCGVLSVWANEGLRFELNHEKVKKAWICESPEGNYVVSVQLNEPYREYFAQLTGNNIGKKLAITFSGQVLINPVIKDRIDSGIIQIGEWRSEEAAKKFEGSLLPKFRKDTSKGSENGEGEKTNTSIKRDAKKYLNMALDSLGKFDLTNDTIFLINGLELIEKAIEADNEYILGYYWKAIMLAKLKEYKRAILTLNAGIEKKYNNEDDKIAKLLFMRGLLRQKTGKKEVAFNDYNRAIKIYRNRLRIEPKNWDAIMNISQALILMDKKKEAVKLLNETIEKYPEEESAKQILEVFKDFDVTKYMEDYPN